MQSFGVRWDGDRVAITRGAELIARARWYSNALIEREGALTPAEWSQVETRIREEALADIEASFASAHDARGVDVTQIDRMLALTPAGRLMAFDDGRRALRALIGHARRG